MIKPRKSLKNPRRNAFQLQNGACFYFGCPMWTADATEFAELHSISPKNLSKFRCTGEHLTPHSEGGSCNQRNIVAAHAFCNQLRHRSKSVRSPDQFRQHCNNPHQKGPLAPPLVELSTQFREHLRGQPLACTDPVCAKDSSVSFVPPAHELYSFWGSVGDDGSSG
jgi:hypothetical protein